MFFKVEEAECLMKFLFVFNLPINKTLHLHTYAESTYLYFPCYQRLKLLQFLRVL